MKTSGVHTEALTRREGEVLALLAEGLSAPEIAQHLGVAASSVRSHLKHLYQKLGVNSRRQAVTRGRDLGWLETPSTGVAALARTVGSASPSPRHNLPTQLTRFVGRQANIEAVREQLAERRLVTLTGPGGVGKTRLALEAAAHVLPLFPDGVWVTELGSLSDPALVTQQVASSVGVREVPGRPILETLTASLRERRLLVVLDNCEHLVEACARLAHVITRDCPRVRVLATSQQALGLTGEVVYPLESLPFPEAGSPHNAEAISTYAAVQLFLDRASYALPGYALNAQNAAAIARLCRRLDGIPLALEMAATRVRLLSAEQIADRLDDRFRLLTGGSAAALPKHRTLQALIDWSYELLTGPEQTLLRRLSVFAGGWDLEAAEAVAAEGDVLRVDVVHLLGSLVDKSLVRVDWPAPGAERRYHLLETIRAYARSKAEAAGELRPAEQRHRDHFLVLAERRYQTKGEREWLAWHARMQPELDNLRQALSWSFTHLTPVEAGPRLVMAISNAWTSLQEEFDWNQRGVELCQKRSGVPLEVQTDMLVCAAGIGNVIRPALSVEWAVQAVAASRRLGDVQRLLRSLIDLCYRYLWALQDTALTAATLAEADEIFDELAPHQLSPEVHRAWEARLTVLRANVAFQENRLDDALRDSLLAVERFEAADDLGNAVDTRTLVADVLVKLGEFEAGRRHLLAGLRQTEHFTHRGRDIAAGFLLRCLGLLEVRAGQPAEGQRHCQASLRRAAPVSEYNLIASDLAILAISMAQLEDRQMAARLAGAAQTAYARHGHKPWEDSTLETLMPGWQARPDQAAIGAAFTAGTALTIEDALALALALALPVPPAGRA